MSERRGTRLELTWPNKDRFLLVPKDENGKPVWVERDHPAASEVRVTDFTGRRRRQRRTRTPRTCSSPATASTCCACSRRPGVPPRVPRQGEVRLHRPAVQHRADVHHYDDWMEHSTWLSFMRDRLLLIKELLARTGPSGSTSTTLSQHRMRCLLDEVFGATNFLGHRRVADATTAKSMARERWARCTTTSSCTARGRRRDTVHRCDCPDSERVPSLEVHATVMTAGLIDYGDLTAPQPDVPHGARSAMPWRGYDPSTRRRMVRAM